MKLEKLDNSFIIFFFFVSYIIYYVKREWFKAEIFNKFQNISTYIRKNVFFNYNRILFILN